MYRKEMESKYIATGGKRRTNETLQYSPFPECLLWIQGDIGSYCVFVYSFYVASKHMLNAYHCFAFCS